MAPGRSSLTASWVPAAQMTPSSKQAALSVLAKLPELARVLRGTQDFCRVGEEAANWIRWCFTQGPAQEERGRQARCHRGVAEELKGQQEAKLVVSLKMWQRGEV